MKEILELNSQSDSTDEGGFCSPLSSQWLVYLCPHLINVSDPTSTSLPSPHSHSCFYLAPVKAVVWVLTQIQCASSVITVQP